MTPDQNPPVDPAALAETKVLPRFPGYREMVLGEVLRDGDVVLVHFGGSRLKPTAFVGSVVEERDLGSYFRPIDPVPHTEGRPNISPEIKAEIRKDLTTAYIKRCAEAEERIANMIAPKAPEGSSPKAPAPVADDRPQALLYDNLLVVWRDNGECLITTRKYPDDTGVNGPQCWPKGISGNYLATHCRTPIFHRSALDVVTGPAKIDASRILCDLGAAQIQISTLTDALSKAREALAKLDRACQNLGHAALPVWDYNPPAYLKKEWEALADVLAEVDPALESPALVKLVGGDRG